MVLTFLSQVHSAKFCSASRSCAAHGQRDWQLLETSGRVASGVAEFVQKSERKSPTNHGSGWGMLRPWGLSDERNVTSSILWCNTTCDILWHLVTSCDILWHLVTSCVTFVRSGSFLLHPGLCAHWEDGLNKQPTHSDFRPRSFLMFLTFFSQEHLPVWTLQNLGHCCKVNWICCERIFPCCRWAWRGLSSGCLARFGPQPDIAHIQFSCLLWFRNMFLSYLMFSNNFQMILNRSAGIGLCSFGIHWCGFQTKVLCTWPIIFGVPLFIFPYCACCLRQRKQEGTWKRRRMVLTFLSQVHSAIFCSASRSCAAHGQRDWQLLETSGRVASGVAEFVRKWYSYTKL